MEADLAPHKKWLVFDRLNNALLTLKCSSCDVVALFAFATTELVDTTTDGTLASSSLAVSLASPDWCRECDVVGDADDDVETSLIVGKDGNVGLLIEPVPGVTDFLITSVGDSSGDFRPSIGFTTISNIPGFNTLSTPAIFNYSK